MKRSDRAETDGAGHLAVLEALDGAGHVSQRRVAELLGVGAASVNRIVRALVDAGHVEVEDEAVRPYAYRLTADGRVYLQALSYERDARVVGRYRELEERIRTRLEELRRRGVERLVFYGAGEVLEVAYPLARELGLRVVGVVDDDPAKQGDGRSRFIVERPAVIGALAPDAVVITSFRFGEGIRRRIEAGSGCMVVEL